MAATQESITNKALAQIGVTFFVTNALTDTSKEAQVARVFFQDCLDGVLASFPWPFATMRFKPSPSTLVTRSDYRYCFPIPTATFDAMLRPLKIWPGSLTAGVFIPSQGTDLYGMWTNPRTPRIDQRVPFRFEVATVADAAADANFTADYPMLLCDYDSPELLYVGRISTLAALPNYIEDAITWALAAQLVMPLVGKLETSVWANRQADDSLQMAQALALSGMQEDFTPDSEFIAVRT